MTATDHDDQRHNLCNDVVNVAISYLILIYIAPACRMTSEAKKYAVSFSRFHCCGRHGIGPLGYGYGYARTPVLGRAGVTVS